MALPQNVLTKYKELATILIVLLLQSLSYALYTSLAASLVYLLMLSSYIYSNYLYYVIAYYCLITIMSVTLLYVQYTVTNIDTDIDTKYASARNRYIEALKAGVLII